MDERDIKRFSWRHADQGGVRKGDNAQNPSKAGGLGMWEGIAENIV